MHIGKSTAPKLSALGIAKAEPWDIIYCFRLHLHNASLKAGGENSGYVDKFGFSCTTCCGFIPMPNNWESSWIVSYWKAALSAMK